MVHIVVRDEAERVGQRREQARATHVVRVREERVVDDEVGTDAGEGLGLESSEAEQQHVEEAANADRDERHQKVVEQSTVVEHESRDPVRVVVVLLVVEAVEPGVVCQPMERREE